MKVPLIQGSTYRSHTVLPFLQKESYDKEEEPKPMFAITYSKPQKRFCAKIIRQEKDLEYVHSIMLKIEKHKRERKKVYKRSRGKRQLPEYKIAPNEREDRDDIIKASQKYKRLKLRQISNSIQIILSGKIFVGEIFRREKFSSLVKNFVTFPRRKFSPRVKNRVYGVYLFAIRVRYNYRYFS